MTDPMSAVFIFPPEQPPPQPVVRYQASPSIERIERLEAEVQHLTATVEELKQIQQQPPVRRERRRWYQRLTTVETWGDDNRA
jgi:hypothetical protein